MRPPPASSPGIYFSFHCRPIQMVLYLSERARRNWIQRSLNHTQSESLNPLEAECVSEIPVCQKYEDPHRGRVSFPTVSTKQLAGANPKSCITSHSTLLFGQHGMYPISLVRSDYHYFHPPRGGGKVPSYRFSQKH